MWSIIRSNTTTTTTTKRSYITHILWHHSYRSKNTKWPNTQSFLSLGIKNINIFPTKSEKFEIQSFNSEKIKMEKKKVFEKKEETFWRCNLWFYGYIVDSFNFTAQFSIFISIIIIIMIWERQYGMWKWGGRERDAIWKKMMEKKQIFVRTFTVNQKNIKFF